ncbi:MAG TPA: DUF1330 domain-containing protein [Myxococcales bacterium]|nr:DUF1330 domain-containing protein [Deltaproteobacteria bacterium]MBU52897.1 DUF1330 domain-containing protein [Deltaproteobacteria bacterium]HAA53752.1 DUF1330 domain-containing protein [Myxococcales bacterium]|tara:strand:+ start:6180 stop:6605 length:426 start_codon:yes stop_codon:yes gene_type:complete
MKQRYIDVTQEQGKAFFTSGVEGPITMLNLLKFREEADYTAHPALAPEATISGQQAYKKYMKHTTPYLQESGGEVLFSGAAHGYLIGPTEKEWDMVLLVRYPSPQVFLSFASNKGYLEGIGHRTAALEDSRLLPLSTFEQT